VRRLEAGGSQDCLPHNVCRIASLENEWHWIVNRPTAAFRPSSGGNHRRAGCHPCSALRPAATKALDEFVEALCERFDAETMGRSGRYRQRRGRRPQLLLPDPAKPANVSEFDMSKLLGWGIHKHFLTFTWLHGRNAFALSRASTDRDTPMKVQQV
jgi:hypothetical protein